MSRKRFALAISLILAAGAVQAQDAPEPGGVGRYHLLGAKVGDEFALFRVDSQTG
jgi:hypothetical protein